MKIFVYKEIRKLFLKISSIMILWNILVQYSIYVNYHKWHIALFVLLVGALVSVLSVCFIYFHHQNKQLEEVVAQIESYLKGNTDIRVECHKEGELYKLFHSINTLSTVLSSHIDSELKTKEFLKEMISTISHQLKTPLTALNIYNGLLQNEAEIEERDSITKLTQLIEQELDRMETLIQNLLKIAKLDADTIVFKKEWVTFSDMMKLIESSFEYRAKKEQKEFIVSGDDTIYFLYDSDWLIEAISNIVKNAFDHTQEKDTITIKWKQITNLIQVTIEDTGEGINEKDIHYIFKRFYRSCYARDKQGVGLGLTLSKAIIEAHNGTITVDSVLGKGSTFTINFLIPTKL